MRKINLKGQSAIEFLIIIGGATFFFVTMMIYLNSRIGDKKEEQFSLSIEDIALTVQEEVELGALAADGYTRVFRLPPKAISRDYDVTIGEGFVYVKTSDGDYALSLELANVTVVSPAAPGLNTIRKINNTVYLNP